MSRIRNRDRRQFTGPAPVLIRSLGLRTIKDGAGTTQRAR